MSAALIIILVLVVAFLYSAVRIGGKPARLMTAGLEVATIAPGWRTELLAVITNPNVALILMMIGIYGLFFEFLRARSRQASSAASVFCSRSTPSISCRSIMPAPRWSCSASA